MVNMTLDDSAEPVSSTVVSAVADREGVDPRELEPRLHSVVDTDALNSFFDGNRGGDLRVEFQYAGYEITVRNPGEIDLEPVE